ncbi:MAG: ATP:cob(I)alamin adenosyltransferase [Ilumatobacteraceae bacterium]
MSRERIYTKAGDDGTTGLFYGGRVRKDSELPTAYGSVDEAQAVLGIARAAAGAGSPIDALLVPIMRDLYVLMAELATLPENRSKLQPGMSAVTADMVSALEATIDRLDQEFTHPTEFVVPGGDVVAAHLDLGRTVVRRRASCAGGCRGAVAGGAVPEPTLRPVVDDGPLARGTSLIAKERDALIERVARIGADQPRLGREFPADWDVMSLPSVSIDVVRSVPATWKPSASRWRRAVRCRASSDSPAPRSPPTGSRARPDRCSSCPPPPVRP